MQKIKNCLELKYLKDMVKYWYECAEKRRSVVARHHVEIFDRSPSRVLSDEEDDQYEYLN